MDATFPNIVSNFLSILRHDTDHVIQSKLDPIEDMLNTISVLRSVGYTRDLLHDTHGFKDAREASKVSIQISQHIDLALELSHHALESRPETSFLPLYYSCLDLAKVYLLVSGRRSQLEINKNRQHGAGYQDIQMQKNFLNETIQIRQNGAVPLIYSTMLGKTIPKKGLTVSLKEIYSAIPSISDEYITITKKRESYLCHHAKIVNDDANGHYLLVHVDAGWESGRVGPQPRELKAYRGIKLVSKRGQHPRYESRRVKGPFDLVSTKLISTVNRNLLSGWYRQAGGWLLHCPISGRAHVLNEDLCIMLAFFHMSNVVRYNPAHLNKLMNSKYWVIILALRKHGYLSFLKNMWSHYLKTCFEIV